MWIYLNYFTQANGVGTDEGKTITFTNPFTNGNSQVRSMIIDHEEFNR